MSITSYSEFQIKTYKKKNILHWMIWSYQGCENYRTLNVFIFFSSNEWTCNLLRKAFDNTRGQKKQNKTCILEWLWAKRWLVWKKMKENLCIFNVKNSAFIQCFYVSIVAPLKYNMSKGKSSARVEIYLAVLASLT